MFHGIFASMRGSTEGAATHGSWRTFSMKRTSSVVFESFHFSIRRTEEGKMILTGYCYREDAEYRAEAIELTEEAKQSLLRLKPESLPTFKPKRRLFGPAADKTDSIENVEHEDGTERRVCLSEKQRSEIVNILQEVVTP